VQVDPAFRARMMQLHTALHILNALVFRAFDGALVAGVQMADDDTARIDFDLPGTDNARIRGLEAEVNAVIEAGIPVSAQCIPREAAEAEPGILRSRSVMPPPTEDGMIRITEVAGIDRQACGGTHVANTRDFPSLFIRKVENKGKHFRRVRIALDR